MAGNPPKSSGGDDLSAPCDKLRFRAVLASPNPDVIYSITSGQYLSIEIGDNNRVEVTDISGAIVGVISSEKGLAVRACLEKGFSFHCRASDVRAPRIEVDVYPA
jgi:hypothetical protein